MIFKKREPVAVLVLSIVTCGVYYLWIYKVSSELGECLQNDNNPLFDMILTLFTCGIYSIYWNYKTGQQVFVAQDRTGLSMPENNAIVCLILSLFGFGPIAAYMIQNSLNRINE